jgi:hypothetical protein
MPTDATEKGLETLIMRHTTGTKVCFPTSLTIEDTAIARTEREIALIQEYRTRPTSGLVTGKLDEHEAVAKLPEPPAEAAAEAAAEEALEELQEETEPEELEELEA